MDASQAVPGLTLLASAYALAKLWGAPSAGKAAAGGAWSLDALAAEGVEASLRAGGLDGPTAAEKVALFQAAARMLMKEGKLAAGTKCKVFFVPGRIEVVGKHTDYCGGRSLLAATNKAFCVVTVDREDDKCRFFSTKAGCDPCTVDMSKTIKPPSGGHWANYPITGVQRLSSNFGELKGLDMAIACDIPGASGMSTSSAVFCAVFLALDARNDIRSRDEFSANITSEEELYEYLGCNENGQNFKALVGNAGVGTFGGSEDHTAIMSCQPGMLNQFAYCPTLKEDVVAFPSDEVVFVIGVSGNTAEKTGDKMQDYNDACLLAQDVASSYNEAKGRKPSKLLKEALTHAGSPEELVRVVSQHVKGRATGPGQFALPHLLARFEQFYQENEVIVPGVARAFQTKNWAELGKLVALSQLLTDTKLNNQVDETRFLAKTAMEEGALAASAFGAGFGGSVWALLTRDKAAAFSEKWAALYTRKFPGQETMFFECVPGPGAFEVKA